MKTIKYFLHFGIISFIASTTLLQSCKKASALGEAPVIVPKNYIAYIYKKDSADAVAFKELMESNDCHVKLVDKANIPTNKFSDFKLIVIDPNTDEPGASTTWSKTDTLALQATGKPMLLMGTGGLQYASKIANKASVQLSGNFTDSKFLVSEKPEKLYKNIYVISVPTSTPAVTLYAVGVFASGFLSPEGETPANVSLLGKFSTAPNYYPLTFEKNRYMNFGFSKGVKNMTQDGKNFMVNLVYYTGGF